MHQPIAIKSAIVLAMLMADARADTLRVPGDYPTIQAAIDAAADGDEILVAPGEYHERPVALGKSLLIRSEQGSTVTVIDGDGAGRVLDVSACSFFTLEGFRITDGRAEQYAGVRLAQIGNLALSDVRVVSNIAMDIGGGAYLGADTVVITDCAVSGNKAADDNYHGAIGGLKVECSQLHAKGLECNSNFAIGWYGGLQVSAGTIALADCEFRGNWNGSGQYTGNYGLGTIAGNGLIQNCTFAGNRSQIDETLKLQGTLRVEGCVFDSNASDDFTVTADATGMFVHCLFENNYDWSATARGRMFESCEFRSNISETGTLWAEGSAGASIDRCRFVRNDSYAAIIGDAHPLHVVDSVFCSEAVAIEFSGDGGVLVERCRFSRQWKSIRNYGRDAIGVRDCSFCAILDGPFEGPWEDLGGNEFCHRHPADFNGDNRVDTADVHAYLAAWAAKDPATDIDANGHIDTRDLIAFLRIWADDC